MSNTPPSSNLYRATFRPGLRKDFKGYARIPISMGNPIYDNSEKLRALFHLVRLHVEEHFTNIVVVIADTLHSHTLLADGYTEEEAHKLCLAKGDEWLTPYQGLIKEQIPDSKIIRWDDVRSSERYKEYLNQLKSAFDQQGSFYNDVRKEAINHITRNNKNPSNARITMGCNYLLDEFAGIAVLLELYPGADVYMRFGDIFHNLATMQYPNIPNIFRTLYLAELQISRRPGFKNESPSSNNKASTPQPPRVDS